jgi:hypothetical protein
MKSLQKRRNLTCRLITDNYPKVPQGRAAVPGGHEVVKHEEREYVRAGSDIHSQHD